MGDDPQGNLLARALEKRVLVAHPSEPVGVQVREGKGIIGVSFPPCYGDPLLIRTKGLSDLVSFFHAISSKQIDDLYTREVDELR
jgi:hypothetical protein